MLSESPTASSKGPDGDGRQETTTTLIRFRVARFSRRDGVDPCARGEGRLASSLSRSQNRLRPGSDRSRRCLVCTKATPFTARTKGFSGRPSRVIHEVGSLSMISSRSSSEDLLVRRLASGDVVPHQAGPGDLESAFWTEAQADDFTLRVPIGLKVERLEHVAPANRARG